MAHPIPTGQSSTTPRPSQDDNFSSFDFLQQDFSLEPLAVSDGFNPRMTDRPSASTSIPARRSLGRQDTSNQPTPSSAAMLQSQPRESLQRRESTASVSTLSSVNEDSRRSIGSISAVATPRAQSPFQPTSGPSHPYSMYPQSIGLARTASIATTSTARAPIASYTSPNGPAHPYSMYPQNTVPEDEAGPSTAVTANPIPLGFPGLSQPYQRRLGPDGEEIGDLVGPGGHTEQLPPYTRYPDDIPRKGQAPEPPEPERTAMPRTPPPAASEETLQAPYSRHSARSIMSDSSRARLTVAAPSEPPQLRTTKEKWKETTKRRVCGGKMPMWAVALSIFALFALGIILGATINHAVAVHRHKTMKSLPAQAAASSPSSTVVATITTTFDASPLATPPPNLPGLPSGTYSLAFGNPQNSSNSCLTSQGESNAWSCDMPIGAPPMQLQITQAQGNGPHMIQLAAPPTPPGPPQFGYQLPGIDQPQALGEMIDLDDAQRGPSYVFQMPYTKLVVLDENAFIPAPPNGKRDLAAAVESHERRLFGRELSPQVGDQPWYCYWNDTFLEGFIYLTQDSAAVIQSSNGSTSSGAAPSSTATNTAMLPPPSGTPYPAYPKVVKLEEHRVADGTPPFCQQMQVMNDGSVVPLPPNANKPTRIPLSETHPPSSAPQLRRRSWHLMEHRSRLERKQVAPGHCRCEWTAA